MSPTDLDMLRAELFAADERLRSLVLGTPPLYSFDCIADADERDALERTQRWFFDLRRAFLDYKNASSFNSVLGKKQLGVRTPAEGLRRVAWLLPRVHAQLSSKDRHHFYHGAFRPYSVDNPALVDD